jgi:hypothetical protein
MFSLSGPMPSGCEIPPGSRPTAPRFTRETDSAAEGGSAILREIIVVFNLHGRRCRAPDPSLYLSLKAGYGRMLANGSMPRGKANSPCSAAKPLPRTRLIEAGAMTLGALDLSGKGQPRPRSESLHARPSSNLPGFPSHHRLLRGRWCQPNRAVPL